MSSRTPTQQIAGALAAVSFAALTQILTLDLPLPFALSLAVFIFAISIPLCIFVFIAPGMVSFDRPFTWGKILHGILIILYIPVSWLGFVALFWHFGALHGATFLVLSLALYKPFRGIVRDIQGGRLSVQSNDKSN